MKYNAQIRLSAARAADTMTPSMPVTAATATKFIAPPMCLHGTTLGCELSIERNLLHMPEQQSKVAVNIFINEGGLGSTRI